MRPPTAPVTIGSPGFRDASTPNVLVTEAAFPPNALIAQHAHDRPAVALVIGGMLRTSLAGRTLEAAAGFAWTEPLAFPAPRVDLDTVLARAGRGAYRAKVPRGDDTVLVTRDAIVTAFTAFLQSSGTRVVLPLALRTAAAGDPTALLGFVMQYRGGVDGSIAAGMHVSVLCSEDARGLDLAKARIDDGHTFMGGARVRMLAEACRGWPVAPATPGIFAAVRSDVPVLLISGELDPNTPPDHAEGAIRSLTHARHVILRGVAHIWTAAGACGAAFVARFIESASASALDVACADTSRAAPFVMPARP